MPLQIREFELNDYEQVIELWKRAGLELSRTDTREGLRRKLQRDGDLFFVVEVEEQIVGAVMGCYDGRRGFVNHLAVDPDFQCQNLGTKIMDELEKRLRIKGCDKVNLLVTPSNSKVVSFYEKLGYNTGELIFMEKWLS